jgi:predicted nucleotidyltransferase
MSARVLDDFDFGAAVGFLRKRDLGRRRSRLKLLEQATEDCRRIVDMIVERHRPARVYQWGSLLDPERFDESSDIDIAVEGLKDAREFLALQAKAMAMTEFPLDLVELEHAEPSHRTSIVERGRMVNERTE